MATAISKYPHRLTALASAVFFCLSAQAQQRPDAGTIQRELEQRPLDAPRAAPRIPAEPARPAAKLDAEQRFLVSSLNVSGNTAFSSEMLLALVRDDLVGKTVTLSELQAAAAKITAFYRARGFLVARAYIPAQRIVATGATIEIAVLEGVLGKVDAENRSRLSEATVTRFLEPLEPGAALTLDTLERPILLLADQAGVGSVSPVIKPGAATGSSDLAIELGSSPLITSLVAVDNHGNRFTGRYRVTGQMNVLSPFGLGESLGANLLKSTQGDLTFAELRGTLPLGGNGWKVGASYSDTDYELGDDFAALDASGTAHTASLFTNYPLVRRQRWNLNATLTLDDRHFEDRVGSTDTVTPKRIHATGVTLSGDVRDALVPNSLFAWNATATAGRVSIDEAGAQAADAASAETQGDYRKYRVALLYLQTFNEEWTMYASFQSQRANKNLDSSEKFFLGGAHGVRAYPLGEAAGDEGSLATLELRYALPQWLGATPSFVLFADYGNVDTNKRPFTTADNHRSLGATGIGLRLIKSADLSLQAYWATRTTGGPATSDSDEQTRVWVQGIKYF